MDSASNVNTNKDEGSKHSNINNGAKLLTYFNLFFFIKMINK